MTEAEAEAEGVDAGAKKEAVACAAAPLFCVWGELW
jgi:hypothetical protein